MHRAATQAAGFSLTETLVALSTTLVVVALVLQSTQFVDSIHDVESRNADRSTGTAVAFGEIVGEITNAGYGLGTGVAAVLPYFPEDPRASSDRMTLRSNPRDVSGTLLEDLGLAYLPVQVSNAERFAIGDLVLLADSTGQSESAEIIETDGRRLAFRSVETVDGNLRYFYLCSLGARVHRLREVRFRLGRPTSGDGLFLVKETDQHEPRIVARDIAYLGFEYLDDSGIALEPARWGSGRQVAAVRVRLRAVGHPGAAPLPTLTTAVALGRHSATLILLD